MVRALALHVEAVSNMMIYLRMFGIQGKTGVLAGRHLLSLENSSANWENLQNSNIMSLK